MTGRKLTSMIFLVLLFTPLWPAYAAVVNTYVDRAALASNESLTLVFETVSDFVGSPDMSAVERNFDIVSRRQSSNLTIINGQTEQKKIWTYALVPKQEGEFLIPPIAFGADHSRAVSIRVVKPKVDVSQIGSPIFLEVETDKNNVYVQEQVLFTVRLYHSVEIHSAKLSEPNLIDAEILLKKLGEDRNYRKTINNKQYLVHERRYAIFPHAPGQFKFEPIKFSGQVGRRAGLFLDPFNQSAGVKHARSSALPLQVRAIPEAAKTLFWLPATKVELKEHWSGDSRKMKVGEPLTRTIELIVQGQDETHLPALNVGAIDNVKQYPDQAELASYATPEGASSSRKQKIAMLPTQAGEIVLPEVRLPWWNVTTGRLETAILPGRTIQATGAAVAVNLSAPPLESETLSTVKTVPPSGTMPVGYWPWVSGFFAIAWLLTLLLWLVPISQRQRREKSATIVLASHDVLEKRLTHACNHHDAVAARNALQAIAASHFPLAAGAAWTQYVETSDAVLRREIALLEAALYAQEKTIWQGNALLAAYLKSKGPASKKIIETSPLGPLNLIEK